MTREAYLEKLEQFIIDESRIVTYKLISRELKISVNEAKQLLHEFLDQHTSENFNTTYFLSGIVGKSPESHLRVSVVTEKNLDKAKKSLSEVTSCHVYSVGKALLEDEISLYRIDLIYNKNDEECSKYVIKHPNIEIKTPILSKTNGVKKEVKTTIAKKEGTGFFKNANSVKKNAKSEPVESSDNKETKTPVKNEKSETQSPAKNSNSGSKPQKTNTLASMWQKKEEKSKTSETSKPNGNGNTKPQQEAKQMPKNNILSMFSKQAGKNAENLSKKSSPISNSTKTLEDNISSKEKCSIKSESPNKADKLKEEKFSKSTADKGKKVNQRKTKAAKHKKDADSEDEFQPKKKKHRRICTFDDSDSESESEEAQDRVQRNFLSPEEPMETETSAKPASPLSDEEPIPPTPPVVSSKGKKKVWKNVQKTFEDEDGFFVTKQEKVLISEDDEDPIPQNSNKSKEVDKQSKFTYRKQASLTSFFKQK